MVSAYGKWIWGILAPLGAWGVFAIAAVDAALMGMPMDAIVAGYIYKHPAKLLLSVLLASAGSALGSIVVYIIGYTGGEMLLRKRLSPQRFEKILHSSCPLIQRRYGRHRGRHNERPAERSFHLAMAIR